MDNIKDYVRAKATGDAGVILHGASTLLVKTPGGFDPTTGAKNPPKEMGVQRDDLVKMRESAAAGVVAAQQAVADAQATVDALDALIADADAVLKAKK